MAHPIRFTRGTTVAVFTAAVFAGAILFGPAPLGQATVSAPASVVFGGAASLEPPDPDPTMPLPEIDGPALDQPGLNGPFHPPSAHRHHHRSTVHPGHI